MAKLPGAFNANEHEGMSDFSAIPANDYTAQITGSEKKESKNKPGNFYWKMEFTITAGEYKGRKLWTNLNLINSNPDAVEMANKELKSICDACGKPRIEDTTELHGIPMLITVKVTPASAQYPEGNEIKGYAPLSGVANPSASKEPAEQASEEPRKKAWEE